MPTVLFAARHRDTIFHADIVLLRLLRLFTHMFMQVAMKVVRTGGGVASSRWRGRCVVSGGALSSPLHYFAAIDDIMPPSPTLR